MYICKPVLLFLQLHNNSLTFQVGQVALSLVSTMLNLHGHSSSDKMSPQICQCHPQSSESWLEPEASNQVWKTSL